MNKAYSISSINTSVQCLGVKTSNSARGQNHTLLEIMLGAGNTFYASGVGLIWVQITQHVIGTKLCLMHVHISFCVQFEIECPYKTVQFNSLWWSDVICLVPHWFRYWFGAHGTSSQYLNKCWFTDNFTRHWNKLQWHLKQSKNSFFQENVFVNVVCKMLAILFRPYHVDMVSHVTRMAGMKQRKNFGLTHWGVETPYGDRDLGQHWLR